MSTLCVPALLQMDYILQAHRDRLTMTMHCHVHESIFVTFVNMTILSIIKNIWIASYNLFFLEPSIKQIRNMILRFKTKMRTTKLFWEIVFYTMSFITAFHFHVKKYEIIMWTTVKSFFNHYILINGEKQQIHILYFMETQQSQRFRSIKSRTNCWREWNPPASSVKKYLSALCGRFPFIIPQLYATDLYTLKVIATFLRCLPYNICRFFGAPWQVVTSIRPPRAIFGFIF